MYNQTFNSYYLEMVVPFVYTEEEYKKLEKERDNCLKEVKLCYNDIHSIEGQISDLEQENKKLKEKLSEISMIADDEKQSIEHILELEQENKKLKEEVEWYKKQYEHTMGED